MYYVKTNNLEFSQQLSLLAAIIHEIATMFGFSKTQEDEAIADAAYMFWVTNADNAQEKLYHSYKDYLYNLRHSGKGGVIVPAPTPIVLPEKPTVVPSGIQYRYTQKINQIKANTNCNDDLLKKLGAYVPTVAPKDPTADKPGPKVVLEGGHPVISYHKYGYPAVNLYKDSGTGYGVNPYKTFTTTSFKDEAALPQAGQSVLWKYKMIYLLHDEETGTMSDEVSIAVGSK